jgi:hypothetical protein
VSLFFETILAATVIQNEHGNYNQCARLFPDILDACDTFVGKESRRITAATNTTL